VLVVNLPGEDKPGATVRPTSTIEDPFATLLTLPNQITIARLLLSVVFFALLVADNYNVFGTAKALWLNISIGVFVLAAVTDFLDGYLARKWDMLSTFGRLADPIVDKVFICGSFVLLTQTSSLVAAWIPVLILAREFLVSALRGYLESLGIAFGAGSGGKLKMVVQSVTIPVVLFYEANVKQVVLWRSLAIVLLIATIVLTITSSVTYVFRARELLKGSAQE
jgi:CDP-diacylglycerol--glycerol-3-phosphate 3-phosphatidyltransferase